MDPADGTAADNHFNRHEKMGTHRSKQIAVGITGNLFVFERYWAESAVETGVVSGGENASAKIRHWNGRMIRLLAGAKLRQW